MTNSFSTLITAFTIAATLGAATTSVSADETRNTRGIAAAGAGVVDGVIGSGPISGGDLGSGRVVGSGPISSGDLGSGRISSGDMGSGRVDGFAGQTSGSSR